MPSSLHNIKALLHNHRDEKRAKQLQKFCKTGPGEYGEGDQFIGVSVPMIRKVAAQCKDLALEEVDIFLQSPIHEERHLALIVLVNRFKKGNSTIQKAIFELYVQRLNCVNNWDLVDVSAPTIVGGYLHTYPQPLLTKLAHATNLWHRRIAIVSTFHFIRQGNYTPTIELATLLREDREDLIHKAVGWMLREVGLRDIATTKAFLDLYGAHLPRTMLRYAIERFAPEERAYYMALKASRKLK